MTDSDKNAERRLEAELMRAKAEGMKPEQPLEELWPGIRQRIDASKVVSLDGSEPVRRPRKPLFAATIAATLVVAASIALLVRARNSEETVVLDPPPDTLVRFAADDSIQRYEEEASRLLDQLTLQRAMIRPEARKVIDRDLATVDTAISELRVAIARDPANRSLRVLLAQSYRHKVEILERAGNAG